MPIPIRTLKKAFLECLQQAHSQSPQSSHKAVRHKNNMIGRPYQSGDLEFGLNAKFDDDDRALADRAFEELKRAGFIQATYGDMADPDKWVYITPLGSDFLRRDLKDDIDLALERISPHLLELRQGMHDAVERTSPDSARQAATSARELVAQILDQADPKCETRKARVKDLLRKLHPNEKASKHEVAIIDTAAAYVEAEYGRLNQSVHMRGTPVTDDVRASVEATERILSLLFGPRT